MNKVLGMKKFLVAGLGALAAVGIFWFFGGADQSKAAADHILINEILFNPLGSDKGKEFIELYNPTTSSIDLTDWSLVKSSESLAKFGATTGDKSMIPSNGFLLVGFNSYAGTPLTDASRSISLGNKTDTITIKDKNGIVVDSISYDNAIVGEGNSWERTSFDSTVFQPQSNPNPQNSASPATVLNTNSTNTATTNTNSASNTNTTNVDSSANSSVVLTGIVFNEAYPNPPVETDEFIELKNTSGFNGSPEGWKIKDAAGNSYTLSVSTVASAGIWNVPRSASGIVLNNDTETITLVNPQGSTVETLSFSNPAEGQSYARSGTESFEWTTTPTPGIENVLSQPSPTQTNVNAGTNTSATTTAEATGTAQTNSNLNTNATNTNTPVKATDFFGVKLSEIFPNPAGDDETAEWIEVFNSGNATIDLSGGSLTDASGKAYVFSKNTVINTHEYKVFFRKTTGIILNNDEETVTLKDATGKKIDSVSYKGAQEGQSYGKIGSTWGWADPTPGKSNESASGVLTNRNTNASVNTNTSTVTKIFGATINEAKSNTSRSVITVAGRVTATVGEVAKNTLYIQDETGGLAVLVEAPNYPKLSRGDTVSIKGKMGTTQGEKRLTVEDGKNIVVVESGREMEAWPTNIHDISAESLGLFVSLRGKVTDQTGQGFVLDDDTGSLSVTFASGDILKEGDTIQVRGIIKKTANGMTLVPRDESDIDTGKVLGESAAQLSTGEKNRDTINQILIIIVSLLIGGAIAYWYLQRTAVYETSNSEITKESDEDRG